MIGTNKYAYKTKECNMRRPDNNTWENWKPIYQEAYTANQRSSTIKGGKFQPLGGEAAAEGKV